MSAKSITAQWHRWSRESHGYKPEGEPQVMPFRETPKFFFVTFQSGWVKRCRKFNQLGQPKCAWNEYYDHGDARITLRLSEAQPTAEAPNQPVNNASSKHEQLLRQVGKDRAGHQPVGSARNHHLQC